MACIDKKGGPNVQGMASSPRAARKEPKRRWWVLSGSQRVGDASINPFESCASPPRSPHQNGGVFPPPVCQSGCYAASQHARGPSLEESQVTLKDAASGSGCQLPGFASGNPHQPVTLRYPALAWLSTTSPPPVDRWARSESAGGELRGSTWQVAPFVYVHICMYKHEDINIRIYTNIHIFV